MVEPLLVGGLTGLTAVLGVAFWQLMARPTSLLALWSDPSAPEPKVLWTSGLLPALRWLLGTVLFISSFLTGLTLAVLLET